MLTSERQLKALPFPSLAWKRRPRPSFLPLSSLTPPPGKQTALASLADGILTPQPESIRCVLCLAAPVGSFYHLFEEPYPVARAIWTAVATLVSLPLHPSFPDPNSLSVISFYFLLSLLLLLHSFHPRHSSPLPFHPLPLLLPPIASYHPLRLIHDLNSYFV